MYILAIHVSIKFTNGKKLPGKATNISVTCIVSNDRSWFYHVYILIIAFTRVFLTKVRPKVSIECETCI